MTQNRRPVRSSSVRESARPARQPSLRDERPAPRRQAAPEPRRAAPPREPKAKGGWSIPSRVWLTLVVCVLLLIAGFVAQVKWPNGFQLDLNVRKDEKAVVEIHSNGPLRINELMSSNVSNIADENGNTTDWVEIMNVSDHTVSLEGYSLAKNENASNVFTFPALSLSAGECVLVFADGTLKNELGGELHAPFRLSSQGGSVMMFGPSGTVVDSVNFPPLPGNAVYARLNRTKWMATQVATPGMENNEKNEYSAVTAREESGIQISEIVAKNTQYAPDEKGQYYDYIELHNTTSEPKDLSGWYLSDDIDRPSRWMFPQGFVLQPDEYRIVYASGLGISTETSVHTSFGLNTEGEIVTLTGAKGTQVDQAMYDLLGQDSAWSRNSDGTWSTATPTPNAPNS